MISIIIPTLGEAARIVPLLRSLLYFRQTGGEVIVVDGGSIDGTLELARPYADQVLSAATGRALQMNVGASCAGGDTLLFLHADTTLSNKALSTLQYALTRSGKDWGRFDVDIEGKHPMLRVVAWGMNARSRLTGIATGDQAIFVRRDMFERCGGFPEIPLMEDIALSRRLRRESSPLCLAERVCTSGRRWERYGVFRTIGLMWRLRLAYFFGADPALLATRYGYAPHHD